MTEQLTQVESPEDEAAYEAMFQEQVKKDEARKSGEEVPAAEPAAKAAEPAAVTPAAEPATPAASDVKPAAEAPKKEEDPNAAILAKLPDDVRDAVKSRLEALSNEVVKERNAARANAGRISAYQRKYEEAIGLKQPVAAPAATPEQTEKWDTFKKDYPDIAESIEAKFAEQNPSANLDGIVEWIEGQKRERFLNDAFEAVETVHPGWRDVVNTKDFQTWKATSPTYEKLADSDEISDAVTLMDLYKYSHAGQTRVDPAAQAASDKLAARREAQAEGARAPANKASTPNEGVDLTDSDQLFAYYASKSDSRLKNRLK